MGERDMQQIGEQINNYRDDEPKPLVSISVRLEELREKINNKNKKRGGINSERADAVHQLMTFMKEYTLKELLYNATKKEKEEYEKVKFNREEKKEWATKVYNRRFVQWLSITKKRELSPRYILDTIKQARSGKHPQSLFWYLIKNKK